MANTDTVSRAMDSADVAQLKKQISDTYDQLRDKAKVCSNVTFFSLLDNETR